MTLVNMTISLYERKLYYNIDDIIIIISEIFVIFTKTTFLPPGGFLHWLL